MNKTSANNKDAIKSEKKKLKSWYKASCNSVLFIIGATVFYSYMFFVKLHDVKFLFSSSLPFYSTIFEYGKTDELNTYFQNIKFLSTRDSRFFWITWIVFVIVICLYLLAWLYSKKGYYGWIAFSFAFYLFDTLVIFDNAGISKGIIVDYLCHIFILVILAKGIFAGYKLKKTTQE